ncbi:MAG: condensation domain-containing protein, partial [Aquabacterium sp.]|uniref:condensation domain-containing protein n=1 Tax=Aquabacterium sp. TaxID=1872578 RepID=UPI00271630E1
MSIQGFVEKLTESRVEIWLAGDKLRYRAPKQLLSPELMAELKARKDELLSHLQAQEQQPFSLTYGQRALWFLHKTAPDSPAYNVAFSAVIASAFDSAVMYQALLCLNQRHAALRLRFEDIRGEPRQFICADHTVDYQLIDASGWDDARLDDEVVSSYRQPFNLNLQQPLFRVRIFSRAVDQHVLLISFHHIVGDGWSLWLLLDDLGRSYQALKAGQEPALPLIPVSYRTYALQQQQWLASAELERDWAYWQERFAEMPPLLNLPVLRPFPLKRSYQGASYRLDIPSATLAALRRLAAERGVTLYVLLLAGLQLLLHRCCNQELLCVGTPLAGRDDDAYADVVGYFVNPMPLLSKLDGQISVAEFIDASSNEILAAMAHQQLPLALMLERLQLARDTGRPPLFQAAFVFQQLQKSQHILDLNSAGGEATADWGGLRLAPYTLCQQEGQFDLSVELMEAGADLIGTLKYNTDVLDSDDAARLADYYRQVLVGLPAYLHRKAAEIPLLDAHYRAVLLHDWNATDYPYGNHFLPDLLTRQAQQTPDHPALIFNGTTLSYGELECRANRLAHYLQKQGAGPESLIAVSMERSIDLVIALHAIVKAGAAYVPLDPDYPQERLDYMIADAGAELLLT